MLRRGSRGEDVREWQRLLEASGYPVLADGVFGPATVEATKTWQREHRLTPDGLVGPVTLAAAQAEQRTIPPGAYEMIQARHYTSAARTAVRWIVLHSTESARVRSAARSVASWFAAGSAPQASSHYVVDCDEIIQCVPEACIAWTQGKANPDSVGIEIVGRASLTREQWLDDYGEPTLRNVARLVREISDRWSIPLVEVGAQGIVARTPGVTTHAAITQGLHVVGGHTDPGKAFPMDLVLQWAQEHQP